jgi:hypothetical protein
LSWGTAPYQARYFVMAVPLLAYFGTMVSAFVGLMLLLNSFLTSSLMERPRPQPYPRVVIEEAATTAAPSSVPNNQIPAVEENAGEANVAANKQASAEKSKSLKVSRVQVRRGATRKEDMARREDSAGRRQDHEYSTALGYAQEAQQQPPFNLFGSGRF